MTKEAKEFLKGRELVVWNSWKAYAEKVGKDKKGDEQGFSVDWQMEEIQDDGATALLKAVLGNKETINSLLNQEDRIELKEDVERYTQGKLILNQSQKDAVKIALSKPISFIQGPPGTGKTWTIIDLMAHIAAAGKTGAIISFNKEAINNIEDKIKTGFGDLYAKTARLGPKKARRDFYNNRDKQFKFRSKDEEGNKYPRDINVEAKSFLEKYPLVLSTIHSLRTLFKDSRTLKYDYVIIDETSQAAVMLGFLAASCAKHLVLVGDEEQLHPIYDNDAITGAAAAASGSSVKKKFLPKGGMSFLGFAFEMVGKEYRNKAFVFLNQHYRCHPGIIGFCNDEVYDGRMIISTSEENYDTDVSCPIRVIYYDGEYDERCSLGSDSAKGSKQNMRQVNILKQIIDAEEGNPLYDKNLKVLFGAENGEDTKASIHNMTILSPFRGQQEAIKGILSEKDVQENNSFGEGLAGEDKQMKNNIPLPLTIHKSQGKEWDRVLFCPVEDGDWEWPWSQKKNMINVMVSRAKKELVIITSTRLMSEKLQRKLAEQYIPPRKSGPNENLPEEEKKKRERDERFLQSLLDYAFEKTKNNSDKEKGYCFIESGAHSIFDSEPVVKLYMEGKGKQSISVPELCFYDEMTKYLKKHFGEHYEDEAKVYYQVPLKAFIDDPDALVSNDEKGGIKAIVNSFGDLYEEERSLHEGNDFTSPGLFKLNTFELKEFVEHACYDFVICDGKDEVKIIIEIQGMPHRYLDDYGDDYGINDDKLRKRLSDLLVRHTQKRDELKKSVSKSLLAQYRYLTLSDDGQFWSLQEDGELDYHEFKKKIVRESKYHLMYDRKETDATETIEKLHADFVRWKEAKGYK